VSGRATDYWLEIKQYHVAEDVNDLDFWKQQLNASPREMAPLVLEAW
jgi:hypothetical protein